MGKFQPGHKLAKGGARPGAGRKPKSVRAQQELLAKIGWAFLTRNTPEVMQKYFEFAQIDPATTRHWMDKVLPSLSRVEAVAAVAEKRVFRFELPGMEQGGSMGVLDLTQSESGRIDARRGFSFILGDAHDGEEDSEGSEGQRAANVPAIQCAASAPVTQEIDRESSDRSEVGDDDGIERPEELKRAIEDFVGGVKNDG